MIRRGWRHRDLMAMETDEVVYWLHEQIAYDKAVAEAIREANKR
ncbi:MAG: hypothetical protein QM651_13760 [Rhodoblastus sp.]